MMGRNPGGDTGSGQYAFVIETSDTLDPAWHWVNELGRDGIAAGRGVHEDHRHGPADTARALIDAYFDHLVSDEPEAVEYWLWEDAYDTRWRIRLWDIPATGYDEYSTVPLPGDPTRRNYPVAMAVDRVEPTSVITLPCEVVRRRLTAKQDARSRQTMPG